MTGAMKETPTCLAGTILPGASILPPTPKGDCEVAANIRNLVENAASLVSRGVSAASVAAVLNPGARNVGRPGKGGTPVVLNLALIRIELHFAR